MVPSSFMISQITPAGVEPGHARQVHRGLGLAGAHQHAAFARAQRLTVLTAASTRARSLALRSSIMPERMSSSMKVVMPTSTVEKTATMRKSFLPMVSLCSISPPDAVR